MWYCEGCGKEVKEGEQLCAECASSPFDISDEDLLDIVENYLPDQCHGAIDALKLKQKIARKDKTIAKQLAQEYHKTWCETKKNKVYKMSLEHRQRISIANKGKRLSPEQRQIITKALKIVMTSPQVREKIRQAMLGRQHTEETKNKIRQHHHDKTAYTNATISEFNEARRRILARGEHLPNIDELTLFDIPEEQRRTSNRYYYRKIRKEVRKMRQEAIEKCQDTTKDELWSTS